MKIRIFGKKGCGKCSLLKGRFDRILSKEPYAGKFDIEYNDLSTEEGLVAFCNMEFLDISRIPSFVVMDENNRIMNGYIEENNIFLRDILALQTNYDAGGVILPQLIRDILNQALKGEEQCVGGRAA